MKSLLVLFIALVFIACEPFYKPKSNLNLKLGDLVEVTSGVYNSCKGMVIGESFGNIDLYLQCVLSSGEVVTLKGNVSVNNIKVANLNNNSNNNLGERPAPDIK